MPLSSFKRILLALFGLAIGAGGVFGAVQEWPSTGPVSMMIIGAVVVVGGIIGQIPSGNLKELQLQWRDDELYGRVGRIEEAAAKFRQDTSTQLEEARTAIKGVGDKLDDFLVALEPEPTDDYDDPRKRLEDWESGLADLDREIGNRQFTGEHYDDGIGLEDLRKRRDWLQDDLAHEERRQRARCAYDHLRIGQPPQSSASTP